jgi:hypothetical protein
MEWTSTQASQWKIKCEELRKLGQHFELRKVRTVEQLAFVQAFCMGFGWTANQKGTSIVFSPPPK